MNDGVIGRSGTATGGTGTNMIIYGKNLLGGSVSINNIPQTQIISVSPTQIRFIVGLAQNGNLCVTTPCGVSNCITFVPVRTFIRPLVYSVFPTDIPSGNSGRTLVYIVGAALTPEVQPSINGINLTVVSRVESVDTTVVPPVMRDTIVVEIQHNRCMSGFIRVTNMNPQADTLSSFAPVPLRCIPPPLPPPTITQFEPREGGPNTEIRITGENLTNVQSVRIGRSPAAIVSIDPLIVRPGPQSRTGHIEVTTPGGTAVSNTEFIFVQPPVISSITPVIIGPRTPVYIRGQNLLRARVNFGGVVPISVQNLTDTLLIATIGTSGTITSVYHQLPINNVPVLVEGRGGATTARERVIFVDAEYRRPMVSLRLHNARGGARIDAFSQTLFLNERRATFLPPDPQHTGDIILVRQNWNMDVTARIRLRYQDSAGRDITILRGFDISNARREPVAFPIPPINTQQLPMFPPRETNLVNSLIGGLWGDLLPRLGNDTLRFGETLTLIRGVPSLFEYNRFDTARINVRARWSDLIHPANPDGINPAQFPYVGRQGKRTLTVELLSSPVDEYEVDAAHNIVRVVLDDPPLEAPIVVHPVPEQELFAGSTGQVFIEATAATGSIALRMTPNGLVMPADIFYDNNYLPLTYSVRTDRPELLTLSTGRGPADFGSKPFVRFTLSPAAFSGSTAAVIITATNGHGGTATHQFIVRARQGAPIITSITPPAGRIGTMITITGRDFGVTPRITFTGSNGISIQATAVFASDTQIRVAVPLGTETGRISITNSVGTGVSPEDFVIIRTPRVETFFPDSARAGTEIVLRGTGFLGATRVLFGTVEAASVRVVSDTEIRAVVSPQGESGTILVANPLDSSRSMRSFTFFPAPRIQRFSPTVAGAGATILVTGMHFSGPGFLAPDTVQLGSQNVRFTTTSPTQLSIIVPDFGTDELRNLPLRIVTRGGTAIAPESFTFVPCPSVDAFSPSSGTFGTTLTILGTGLQAVTGITVGGIPVASWTLDSPSRITATIGSVESGAIELIAGRCTVAVAGRFTYQAPSRPIRFLLPRFTRAFPGERTHDTLILVNQSSAALSGTLELIQHNGNFSLGAPTNFTVPRNQVVRLPVAFTPRSGGTKSAVLRATVQGVSSPVDTALTAHAGIWQVSSVEFDTVRTGRSTLRAVQIINRDTASARIDAILLPSDGAFRVIGQQPRWIGRGDTSAIIVRCQPGVAQQRLQTSLSVVGSGDTASAQLSAIARLPQAHDIVLETRIIPSRTQARPGNNIALHIEITRAQNLDRLRGTTLQWHGSLRWTHGALLHSVHPNAPQPTPHSLFATVRNTDPRQTIQRVVLPSQGVSSLFSPPFLLASVPCGVYYSQDSISILELEELICTSSTIEQRIFVEEPADGSFSRFTALSNGRLIQRTLPSVAITSTSPNPGQTLVRVTIRLENATALSLNLTNTYGVLVQKIADGWYSSGEHTLEFDATTLPSGSYMLLLHTEHDAVSRFLQILH
ncbi:MAG: IPT/TIG domain-containing protein [Bacteroidota bacterium]|nr:IPT/TIG domain-containing protein [Candidatus Kapabacteria bacterium]MDW8220436.1 IPT/TIG domain-containing protein [Bacteroidota bacterium]